MYARLEASQACWGKSVYAQSGDGMNTIDSQLCQLHLHEVWQVP